VLYLYPTQARVGKNLPKSKIYQHARVSASLRRKFIDQIANITWAYKLSPETINLPALPSVPEIEVFVVELKGNELSTDVIRSIDAAIPFPAVYEIVSGGRTRVVAAHKRPSEGDFSKWVTETYFETEWYPQSKERIPLYSSIDLGRLYEQMLTAMMPITRRRDEAFPATVARAGEIRRLEREAEKLNSKLNKEKQFNRKVEINAELRDIKREIEKLSQ